jgi:hypothetical protein
MELSTRREIATMDGKLISSCTCSGFPVKVA